MTARFFNTPLQAEIWLRLAARAIGGGFHCDNKRDDYNTKLVGVTPVVYDHHDQKMREVFELLENPYGIAMDEWRRAEEVEIGRWNGPDEQPAKM